MVQITPVLVFAAAQVLGGAVAVPADDAQHVLLDPQGHSAKDVYTVKDELVFHGI